MIDYGLSASMKSILIVRIGAMGDIIHALPGVVSLRRTFPHARITWVVDPKWTGLLAGWVSKQWPLEYFQQLALALRSKLGMPLVINGAPGAVPDIAGTLKHESGIAGLIHATRKAALVVGVDSGPLHLAAALGKSGV